MVTIAVCFGVTFVVLVVQILVFHLLAQVCHAGTVTWGRSTGAIAAVLPISLVGQICVVILQKSSIGQTPGMVLLSTLGAPLLLTALCAAIVKIMLRSTYWRGFSALLMAQLCVGIPSLLILKSLIAESYVSSANAMAPTLLGWHRTGTCPNCSGRMILPVTLAANNSHRTESELETRGICTKCLQAGDASDYTEEIHRPDQLLALKILRPKRWDLVVYVRPDLEMGTTTVNVSRLVGLPGETIEIRNGELWCNGEKLVLPEEIGAIRYLSAEEIGAPDGASAWSLGRGEAFVLGDFSERAFDSRLFGPVPTGNIRGIAAARYWPISRKKIWH